VAAFPILIVQSERDFGRVREPRKLDLKIETRSKEDFRAIDRIDGLGAAGGSYNGEGKGHRGNETSMHFAIHHGEARNLFAQDDSYVAVWGSAGER